MNVFYRILVNQKPHKVRGFSWIYWDICKITVHFGFATFVYFTPFLVFKKKEFSQSRICTSESRILSLMYVNFSPESANPSRRSFFVYRNISEFMFSDDKKDEILGPEKGGTPPVSLFRISYGSQTNLAILNFEVFTSKKGIPPICSN